MIKAHRTLVYQLVDAVLRELDKTHAQPKHIVAWLELMFPDPTKMSPVEFTLAVQQALMVYDQLVRIGARFDHHGIAPSTSQRLLDLQVKP
jgi:hypothetical protein